MLSVQTKWLKVEVSFAVKAKLVEQKSDIDKAENFQLRNVKSQVQKMKFTMKKNKLAPQKSKIALQKILKRNCHAVLNLVTV